MIPYGPFHPDKAGLNTNVCREARNCIPLIGGTFKPLRAPAPFSANALDGACEGAVTIFDDDGDVFTFAGDATKLYELGADLNWVDVSRLADGAYQAGSGEPWRFGTSGNLVIACTIGEDPQKYILNQSTNFEPLGGNPPRARFIANVRETIVLAGLLNDERTVRTSGIANAEQWDVGINSATTQTFQDGGPIRGVIGGEVGYIMHAERVTRMTFVPDSDFVFQYDQVEGGRGLANAGSLIRLGQNAYYYGDDNFYKMSLVSGAAQPIGVGKWSRFFADDLRSVNEPMIAGIDPLNRLIVWGYVSKGNPASTPDKLLLYDWALDEAAIAAVPTTAIARLLSPGVTLDTMDQFGTMDELAFSLDSPVWQGGSALLGVFGADRRLSYLQGATLEAVFVSSDMQAGGRQFINGVRPLIDTTEATVALSARESQGEAVVFEDAEAQEDNGVCPQHLSGHVMRARVEVPAGAEWTKFEGALEQELPQGQR
ncbi:MAG: hypothetical protein AAGD43_06830 [Pseudomonadota bacterium]